MEFSVVNLPFNCSSLRFAVNLTFLNLWFVGFVLVVAFGEVAGTYGSKFIHELILCVDMVKERVKIRYSIVNVNKN